MASVLSPIGHQHEGKKPKRSYPKTRHKINRSPICISSKPKTVIDICPKCLSNLDGGEIPEKDREHFRYRGRFSRLIAIIDSEQDRCVGFRCPDCGFFSENRRSFWREYKKTVAESRGDVEKYPIRGTRRT